MAILLSLLAGAFVIICVSVNGQLSNKVGLIQAGMTNYFVGLVSSIIYILIANSFIISKCFNIKWDIPFYCYLGGVVGSLIMVLNSLVINKLSAVYVTILLFVGQLAAGMLIDYISLGILSPGKIIGGILIVIGLLYYIKGDKKGQLEFDKLQKDI